MVRAASEPESYGPIYTRGTSFRARAEARQRQFRAETLGVGWSSHGHWLDDASTAVGANFVTPLAFALARERDAAGKGVTDRTFRNMLSSQAMAFNIFAPLANDLSLATRVLGAFIPELTAVRSITIEYTPAVDLLRDQSSVGGVDCDLLIEATFRGEVEAIVVIETKFVEPELSRCDFRKPKRVRSGQTVCPADVHVSSSRTACAYVARKNYAYWERADALCTLKPLTEPGCPFAGPLWQLWVNHTLAHAEAQKRGASEARLLLCAPSENDALLQNGAVVMSFQALLERPETLRMLPLEPLLDRIATEVDADQNPWVDALRSRYAKI